MDRILDNVSGGSNFGKRYMETGSCFIGETKKRCALTRDDCLEYPDEEYKTYSQALEKDYDGCDPNKMPIGRCLEENVCAAKRTDCTNTLVTNFEYDDKACTIQRDTVPEWNVNVPKFTLFGSCKDDNNKYFCAYSNSDCGSTETYMTPAETKAEGIYCDCAEVRVVGCIPDADFAYCALKESDCADGDEKRSAYDQRLLLAEGSQNLDCRLCQRKNTKKPTLRPTKYVPPTQPTTNSPAKSPIPLTFAPTESPTSLPVESRSAAVVVAAVSGGIVAVLVTLGIIYLRLFRKNEKEYDTNTPPKSITLD